MLFDKQLNAAEIMSIKIYLMNEKAKQEEYKKSFSLLPPKRADMASRVYRRDETDSFPGYIAEVSNQMNADLLRQRETCPKKKRKAN